MTNNIGYCRPPTHSRFKKGKSGNPKGRPKEVKIANPSQLLIEILNTPTSQLMSNKNQTVLEALLRSWVKQSSQGRSGATKALMELIGKLPPSLVEEPFRENSESAKLMELFRQRAESYENGSADVFEEFRNQEEWRPDTDRRS